MKRRHSCLLFFLLVTLMFTWLLSPANGGDNTDPVDSFLAKHWQHPLTPQGKVPQHWSQFDQPLAPQTCGQCHPAQFNDWKTSRHGMAMGPGIMAQLVSYAADADSLNSNCLRCHAPLAEQSQSLADALGNRNDEQPLNTGLHDQGLLCAGCHVRNFTWFGPPRRDGSFPDNVQAGQFPHQAWTASDAFEDSRICSSCHQFPENGYALNGKLLENTYNEWLASRYATESVSCQSCHMPDRRHVWRGIHDKDMVASGITISTSTPVIENQVVNARLTVENSGTGHYFPTYVTPRVIITIAQGNQAGEAIEETTIEHVIAREVPLNIRSETFDTRIAPGQKSTFEYQETLIPEAENLMFQIRVEPDAFYERFYANRLASNVQDPAQSMYQQALQEAQASAFIVFEEHIDLAQIESVVGEIPEIATIPAGEFIFGSDAQEREAAYQLDEAAYGHNRTRTGGWYDREVKRGKRKTKAYSIATTPITNGQYFEFIKDTGYIAPDIDEQTWKSYRLVHPYKSTRRFAWINGKPPQGREDHPVVLISHNDAEAYATWLSGKTGHSWRLPTEVEWEKAARGEDGERFPWGDKFDPTKLNSHDNGLYDTAPVGIYANGASPFGLLDAAGQVFEWTATMSNNKRAIVKGGSWDDKGCGVCRPAARHSRPLNLKHILIGFRLVRE